MVEVEGVGLVTMDQLKVGDKVLSLSSKGQLAYEEVGDKLIVSENCTAVLADQIKHCFIAVEYT